MGTLGTLAKNLVNTLFSRFPNRFPNGSQRTQERCSNLELILRDYQIDMLTRLKKAYLKNNGRRKLVVLPCGAGKTVCFASMARDSQAKGKTVWFLVHRRELLDQTVETFQRFGIEMNSIHLGMVQSVARHINAMPKPDFIIFDEAHFSQARTWQKIVETYPDAYYVGLTATPVRLDGKPLGDTYDEMIVGITTQELIERGLLANYNYWSRPLVNTDAFHTKRGDFDAKEVAQAFDDVDVFGDVVDNYRRIANGKKTICYVDSIEHSIEVAKNFNDAGITAVHFDGSTPDKQRRDIVKKFRDGEITILCNVDLISCGFDVPDCECCILLRPTQSTALFIQQSMRALRPLPGKKAEIIDHVDNVARHGLPDQPRQWSLEGKMKKPKPGEVPIKTCPKCFMVVNSSTRICPGCDHVFQAEVEEKRYEPGELVLIDKEAYYRNMTAKQYKKLKSFDELMAVEKAKGYKRGFAIAQAIESNVPIPYKERTLEKIMRKRMGR